MAAAAAPEIPAVEAFVANIDYNASAKDVAEYFSQYGRVVRCKLPPVNKTQSGLRRHKGYGFVTFASVHDLEVVLQADPNHRFRGRPLKIKKSNQAQGVVLKDENGIFLFQDGCLDVGVYLEEQGLFLRKWTVPSQVLTVVNFQRRYAKFSYFVPSRSGFGKQKFHIRHNLDDVFDLVDTQCHNSASGRNSNAIIFRNQSAPKLNEEEPMDLFASLLQDDGLFWESVPTDDEGDTVKRVVDFSPDSSLSNYFDYMLASNDITRHRLKFHSIAESIGCTVTRTTGVTPIQPLLSQPKSDAAKALSFRVLFQIDVLVTEGIVYHDLLPPRFFQLLGKVENEDTAITALQSLLQTDIYPVEDPVTALTEAIQLASASKDQRLAKTKKPHLDPSTAVPIHRVFVTPLRTICWGPEVDTPNRVIREFAKHTDRFLRVSFTDEDWNRLQISKADEAMEGLYERVRHVLQEGLLVGGRYFEFLATSSSQLREHACWFFSPTDGLNAANIRAWMGDFSHIKNVAKYAARMGQCFSSTVTSKECEVRVGEFQDYDDIKTDDGKYTFTDGIGSISPEFARLVSKTVGYLKGRVPSAFQIRFSGYKGVVAVDERMRGGGIKLRLRPSMKKFQCPHYYLEVCKTTNRMPCFLNRQIVTLLSTLGVADKVFLNKQDLMIADLEKMLKYRQVAVSFLKQSCTPSPNSVVGGVIEMMNAGFDMNEPYLQGVLRAHRLAQLQDLRNRARIFLKEGGCLMGVIDETRTLRYGQVFIRVTDPVSRRGTQAANTITGLVAVAKNPCFHPGDVRTLQAVNVPHLHHLVDCLVFPAQGPRPHTDECSGSDLDGDLYFVTWDRDLIPPRQNLRPMDYQEITPTPSELPRPIGTPDLHKFFINYMKNDQLGPIANAHLVWSDYSTMKAEDPKCLKLAELHSVAVDYPKTGVPADMRSDLRPPFYPNFMNKSDRVPYRSRSVLGELFALIDDDVQHEMRAVDVSYIPQRDFDPILVIEGYEEYIDEAANLRDQYNHDLRGIMAKYDIKKESQAITGDVLRVGRKLRRSRLADIRMQIRREVNELVKSYRVAFEQEFSSDDGTNRRLRVASAWYCATYSPSLRPELDRSFGRRRGQKPLLSFPWILYDCLCEIKQSHLPR